MPYIDPHGTSPKTHCQRDDPQEQSQEETRDVFSDREKEGPELVGFWDDDEPKYSYEHGNPFPATANKSSGRHAGSSIASKPRLDGAGFDPTLSGEAQSGGGRGKAGPPYEPPDAAAGLRQQCGTSQPGRGTGE